MIRPVVGAAVGALAMWAWIAFVNRPVIERFTIVYRGREMVAEGFIDRRQPEKENNQ